LLNNNNHTPPSDNAMDTDAANQSHGSTNAVDPINPTTLNLLAIINDLKSEILNFTQETRAIVQTQSPPTPHANHPSSLVT